MTNFSEFNPYINALSDWENLQGRIVYLSAYFAFLELECKYVVL
jgi:hypothetical protein